MTPVKLRTREEVTSIPSTSCSVCTIAAPEVSFHHSSETPLSTWGRPPLPCVLPRVFVCCEAQLLIPAAGLGVSFASSETRQNVGCYPLSTIDKSIQTGRRRLDDAGVDWHLRNGLALLHLRILLSNRAVEGLASDQC
jgi:hypothetical protein